MSQDPFIHRPGERVYKGHFGPNDPTIDGVRWSQYPRGLSIAAPTLNRLFDGAPPLNPFTNRPYLGAVIDQPRGFVDQTLATSSVLNITVGDSNGGAAFRRCVAGPGTPVTLALGQYQNAKIVQESKSTVIGTDMNFPLRIQWVDALPAQPDAGLLRSPITALVAAANTPVPDGAAQMVCEANCVLTFTSFDNVSGGVAFTTFVVNAVAGQPLRTLAGTVSSNIGVNVVFFLAGL